MFEGEETARANCERHAEGSADRGEQKAFGQYMTRQVARARAERFANRHYVAALEHAR